MARVPPLQRLKIEDFKGQEEWIGKLVGPLNTFMEQVTSALNKNLTINDNMQALIKTVTLDGSYPVRIPWGRAGKPSVVLVGAWQRLRGTNDIVTLTGVIDTFGDIVEFNTTENPTYSFGQLSQLIRSGMRIRGASIPDETNLVNVYTGGSSTAVTGVMSKHPSGNSTESVTLSLGQPVTLRWTFNSSGQIEISTVSGIYPASNDKYQLTIVAFA
jgi:hypothetical protein